MLVGERIKKERKKKGYTQEEFGKILNVSKVSVCGYEKGTRTPTIETFLDIVKTLDVEPNYLLGRDIKAVSENEEFYIKLSTYDLEIINELKKYPEMYNKLCSNPSKIIAKLDEILNKNKG